MCFFQKKVRIWCDVLSDTLLGKLCGRFPYIVLFRRTGQTDKRVLLLEVLLRLVMAKINTFQEPIDLGKLIGLDVLQDQKNNLLKDIQERLKKIGVYGGDLDELSDPIIERSLIRFCNAVFLDNLQTWLLGG
jgi:hypothetical protein